MKWSDIVISLIVLSVVCIPQYTGCERPLNNQEREGKGSNSPEKAQGEQTLAEEDSNIPLPCWDQSWDCGDWHPLDYILDQQTCFYTNMAGKTVLWSGCRDCSSQRLINPENWTERIVLSYEGMIKNCKHNWTPSTHAWSLDPIEQGDALIIVYKGHMYVVLIGKISVYADKVQYKIAEVPSSRELPLKINLNNLGWKKEHAKDKIPLADREIAFSTHEFDPGDGAKPREVLCVWYDYYYGGPTPNSKLCVPVHIGIVHRHDLPEYPIIDLTKFRFKTWEDGLGNRCDKGG